MKFNRFPVETLSIHNAKIHAECVFGALRMELKKDRYSDIQIQNRVKKNILRFTAIN